MSMTKKRTYIVAAAVLVVITTVLQFIDLKITNDKITDGYIKSVFCYAVYMFLTVWILNFCGYKAFCRPQKIFCFFIAMIVAVNNFPFSTFIKGESGFAEFSFSRAVFFILNCLFTAAFEELLFRGLLFNFFVETAPRNKKGVIKAVVISSLAFGAAHFLNLFAGAGFLPTLLQAGYTSLVGALCAFTLFKTRNVAFPWLVHATYNVCGLILTSNGLGCGVNFDAFTVVLTIIIGVAVGTFVLIDLLKVSDEEIKDYAAQCLRKIEE